MKEIFVFGSNLAGRHGKGAALCALKQHSAIYGKGIGRQGNSYAIPTKDEKLKTLPLTSISIYITMFKQYVEEHYNDSLKLIYNVTPIGCGLAGYSPKDIAPMFIWAIDMPAVVLPKEFLNVLNK